MYSFCPSDYLAIRSAPEILQLTFDSEESVDYYKTFERSLSHFFDAERMLYFPDGYLALVALLRDLIQEDDWILIPPETDGAIVDVLEIIERQCESARIETLTEKCWEKIPETVSRIVILASGICETYGKIAPIDEWSARLEAIHAQHGISGMIILDDSLGVGLLGEHYRGTFEHFGVLPNREPNAQASVQYFFSGSFSDAFGASGGFIVGDRKWLRVMRRHEPCCCSWSEIPLSSIVAGLKALELAAEPERHEILRKNVQFLAEKLTEAGITFQSNPFLPFILVKVPNPKETLKVLEARGCRVGLTHFTKKPQFCISVTAAHQPMEIEFLVKTLAEVLHECEEKKRR
ncbi:MAG: hypothetical protein Q4C70_09455 [Planctomycetia bacterium]|nr:hypothetical protein [Planctomycetia bacterium]